MAELASEVSPSQVIPNDHLLQLFTYLGTERTKLDEKKDDKKQEEIKIGNLPYRTRSRYGGGGLKLAKFKWSEKTKHTSVVVSNNGKTLNFPGTCLMHLYVKADTPFINGRNYYEITLDTAPGCYMGLGVCTDKWPAGSVRLGADNESWSVRVYPGQNDLQFTGKHHGGQQVLFDNSWAVGNRVGILVDLAKGTISCYKNGELLGEMFNDLKGRGKLWPAIELCHSTGCTLTEPKIKHQSQGKISFSV